MKRRLRSMRREQRKQETMQEREMEKTKKIFERSLSGIRSVYERSQQIMEKDLGEFESLAKEQRQKRAKFGLQHLTYLRTIEQELMQDELFQTQQQLIIPQVQQFRTLQNDDRDNDAALEETSKYSICLNSQRNNVEQQTRFNEVPRIMHQQSSLNNNNSYLEKTTPRSARPNYVLQQQQPKAVAKGSVPKLPIPNSKLNVKERQQEKSLDCSSIQQMTAEKPSACKGIDESILLPPCMIGANQPIDQWDSMLDDTKVNINNEEILQIQKDYQEKVNQIQNPDERILFKQLYAMQQGINPNLLQSQTKYDCTTPRELAYHKMKDKNTQECSSSQTVRKGEVTAFKNKIRQIGKSGQKSRQKPDSSAKKYKFTDVKYHEMMQVQNDLSLDSPIRDSYELRVVDFVGDQDVRVEDIINAPSLSVSLRTATDAGAFFHEVNQSFFRSDLKRGSHIKPTNQNKTQNESYLIYHEYEEEDSMIRDFMKDERHKQVFNIIDDNNNNGELSGNNLEESCSSYSKTGGNLKNIGQLTQQSGMIELEFELKRYVEGVPQKDLPQQVESFKSTAVQMQMQPCLESLQLSKKNSQIPTPAFDQRQTSSVTDKSGNEYGQLQICDQSLEMNRRKGNYLMQNHSKLVERIQRECVDETEADKENFSSMAAYNSYLGQLKKDQTASQSSISITSTAVAADSPKVIPNLKSSEFRSTSAHQHKQPNKLKLNLVRKGAPSNPNKILINQSAITMIDNKKPIVKIPLKQIQNHMSINNKPSNHVSAFL